MHMDPMDGPVQRLHAMPQLDDAARLHRLGGVGDEFILLGHDNFGRVAAYPVVR